MSMRWREVSLFFLILLFIPSASGSSSPIPGFEYILEHDVLYVTMNPDGTSESNMTAMFTNTGPTDLKIHMHYHCENAYVKAPGYFDLERDAEDFPVVINVIVPNIEKGKSYSCVIEAQYSEAGGIPMSGELQEKDFSILQQIDLDFQLDHAEVSQNHSSVYVFVKCAYTPVDDYYRIKITQKGRLIGRATLEITQPDMEIVEVILGEHEDSSAMIEAHVHSDPTDVRFLAIEIPPTSHNMDRGLLILFVEGIVTVVLVVLGHSTYSSKRTCKHAECARA